MVYLSVITAFLVIAIAEKKSKSVNWSKGIALPLECFAIGIIIIRVIHPVGSEYIVYAFDLLILFPMLYIAVNNQTDRAHIIDLLSVAIILSGILSFIISVFTVLNGTYKEMDGRLQGITGQPNYYGMIGLSLVMAAAYIIIRKKEDLKIIVSMAVVAGIGSSMIIKAVSRTAMLAMLACVVIALIYLVRNKKAEETLSSYILKLMLIIVVVAVSTLLSLRLQTPNSGEGTAQIDVKVPNSIHYVAYAYAAQESESPDFKERFDTDKDINALSSGRINIWKRYAEHFNLIGNDYDAALENGWFDGLQSNNAHNNFIDYAFRLGIPVTVLYALFFLGIVFKAVWIVIRERNIGIEYLWAAMTTVSYCVYAMLEISTVAFIRYVPCLFFLSIAPLMVNIKRSA